MSLMYYQSSVLVQILGFFFLGDIGDGVRGFFGGWFFSGLSNRTM